MTEFVPNWGPTGQTVYERTYSRTKPDGSKETWADTLGRVIHGNINLVPEGNLTDIEHLDLALMMADFSIIPAGRHLWASGVKGRQFLFNCWVAGWGSNVWDHFRFTFLRLMEGGGVGANYSSRNTEKYGPPAHRVEAHIVCDPSHPDYEEMLSSGLLSPVYSPDYQGAYMELEDSREGWAEALTDLLRAAWDPDSREVRVYDVSRVRWKGARLKTFGGFASGPGPLAQMLLEIARVINGLAPEDDPGWRGYGAYDAEGIPMDPISAMEIDHAIAMCVVAGGNRRSARMSMLDWDDPFIWEFIHLKQATDKHWTTNISVAVDDKFFQDLEDEKYGGSDTARLVLEEVALGMLSNGEPGFANLAKANAGEITRVEASNPCGEIFLNEGEACNLGHINLEKFVDGNGKFMWAKALEAAKLMTRFLIRATYGDITDAGSRQIMDNNRRIGVGLLGVQAAFAKMGIRYSDIPGSDLARNIVEILAATVRQEAHDYSFQLRIPEPVKVTTVAPTGSIAKLPGTTEGIHPIYSRYFIRRIRFSTTDPAQMQQVSDYAAKGYHVEDCMYADNTVVVSIPTKERLLAEVETMGLDADIVQSVDELSIDELLAVQEFFQASWADNAVSFTANIPEGKLTHAELVRSIIKWLPLLKGTTIMPDGSRPQAPYERITEAEYYNFVLETGHEHTEDSTDEDCANGACPVR